VSRSNIFWLVLVVLAAGFVLNAALCGGTVHDDAYISFRYAARWVLGEGLTYNPGAPVEGYSNFLWVVVAAATLQAGLDPVTVIPAFGVGCGAILVIGVGWAGRALAHRRGAPPRTAGLFAAAAIAVNPSLVYYAGSGLETAAFALALLAAGVALVSTRPSCFAAASLVAVLIRPEAALLVVAGSGWLAVEAVRGRVEPRPVLAAGALLAFGLAAYLGWKLSYFGSIAPNTLQAKSPDPAAGLEYVSVGLLPLVGTHVVALSSALPRWRSLPALGLSLLWLLFELGTALSGGDWMPLQRRSLPALPWLLLAADLQLSSFARANGTRMAVAGAAVAALNYLPAVVVGNAEAHEACAAMAEYTPRRSVAVRVARELAGERLAMMDIGLPGYQHPLSEIVDLAGLTDARVAALPGAHHAREIPARYLAERAPDAFLIVGLQPPIDGPDGEALRFVLGFPTEHHILRLPWFREHYEYERTFTLNRTYYYHLFISRAGRGEGQR